MLSIPTENIQKDGEFITISEISRKPYVENKLKKTSNSRCSSEGFDRGSH